jgi:hypothetical protein
MVLEQESGGLIDPSQIQPRIYEVYDHEGKVVQNQDEPVAEIEAWRARTRNAMLSNFPERQVTDNIDPSTQRRSFADLGFETAPVVVIPNTESSLRKVVDIVLAEPRLAGNAFDGIEDILANSYHSLTCNSPDIDLVLFVDPTSRIKSESGDEEVTEEFSRITLAHELGHSAVRSPDRVKVTLDNEGNVAKVNVFESAFGIVTEPVDLAEDNYWVGSLWDEGYATLMASTQYRPLSSEYLWTMQDIGTVALPGWLLSHVPNDEEIYTADNNSVAALALAKYNERYPGILDTMHTLSRREISRDQFAAKINTLKPGLYEKLNMAVHNKTHVAAFIEAGIEIED